MTVEIDGSTTQFGQIDLAIGGTVRVGPFLLRILAAEIGSRGRRRSTSSAPDTDDGGRPLRHPPLRAADA